MTEYKPFSGEVPEPRAEERTVAIVLSIPSEADDAGRLALRPMGGTSLVHQALAVLQRAEADERWLLSLDRAVDEVFAQGNWEGVRLLRSDGQGDAQPGATHLLLLGPFHPFLRASTLGEAVRLFKMRTDLSTLIACTRNRDALFDEQGALVVDERDDRALYRAAHAFQIAPREPGPRRGRPEPYPFELSAQEGFFVDTEFEFELVRAWHERRQGHAP